ncbi:hypothetical protein WKI68_24555 [Streptomyces sp. MS1.HAVA.3]|uniref:Uncharacterized protein n=1 Tax=Streptomyces caledonius TaxID=3134107 RepID=A0ABU8U726_9ACTN
MIHRLANSPAATTTTAGRRIVSQTRNDPKSAPPESSANHTRRLTGSWPSAAAGAARKVMPRARGALKKAAGTYGLTWLA